MRIPTFIYLLLLSFSLYSAQIDTLAITSASMNKNIEVLIVSPIGKGEYPVIYLLHGYGGNAKTWIGLKPDLPSIADEKGVIFVCPDGKNSWYWDSPKDPSYCYETFVAKELVNYIDTNYSTVKDRSKRAITGLSMGGHGAIWISFRNKDIFGAAGSMSGGLDIRPFPNNWEMSRQLGQQSENNKNWEEYTVINQIDKISNGDLAIIIDCGYEDFFYRVNNDFHNKLRENKIEHDYIQRPGEHNGAYWANAIDYQILFFEKYFNR